MPRPRQPGLTENELEVMQILWAQAPLTVSDLLNYIQRKPAPAYTSLLTLVQTMEKKGYIKHQKSGKAFSYKPVLKQEKFLISEVKRIAKRLLGGSPGKLVLNLVENEKLNQAEVEALKKLLKD
ncbi:MAG: BlaI/MecI/CopY family transcriptional regulator [Gammaproteobacteria bacterium]|nr:BlaI/MecI/CopY family transcriptional regulator [Gammaproteobacteria bacterium]